MISLNSGQYTYRIRGDIASVEDELTRLYPHSLSHDFAVADFDIEIQQTSLLRTLLRPQVTLNIEGHKPFNPIHPAKLLPSIEWAMNWCVSAYDHTKLLIHCSVAVKNGKAILFPAKSGSGKSTLSAYLGLNGWHLYSDEMAIINLDTGYVEPVFRPASLKNESIEIIKPFVQADEHYMSRTTKGTHKGDIAHVRTMSKDLFDKLEPSKIAAVLFLDFDRKKRFNVYEIDKSIGLAKIITNGFNYSVIGEAAFSILVSIVNQATILEVSYSEMADIKELIGELVI
jgi:HprK-related kinase A